MRIILLLGLAVASYCLTDLENAVLEALKEASANIEAQNQFVKEDTTNVQSQKATDDAKLEQLRGDLLSEATKILIAKYGIDILPQLESIDIDALMNSASGARKKRYATEPSDSLSCGARPDIADCSEKFHDKYRSVTGLCNNRRINLFGKAVTPTRRLLGSAGYSDSVNAIRTQSSNGASILPSTRYVSNKLHDSGSSFAYDFMTNHMMMQFGQMIAHDVVFTPSSVGPKGETLDCSACSSSDITSNCAPIPVPSDDTYFPPNSCIRLTRALNAQKALGVRQPVDQNTHFIDLSITYGSSECEAASVREFQGGRLAVYNGAGYPLPPQNKNDSNCQSKDPYFCFTAGDFRNCLHPGLIPFHVVYIRQHNLLADRISKALPNLNDEQIYQQARMINIAQFQHHVYNEYLPKLLGDKTMKEFNLYPQKSGFFKGYDDSLKTSPLTYEFTAAAFRFGHSQARKELLRTNNNNGTTGSPLDIGNHIFYADAHYDKAAGGTESILNGMMKYPSMMPDRYFSFPIRNQLFEIRGKKASGVDLVAVNIMRGRDVGLYPYNAYRETVGLKKAVSFNDLLLEMSSTNVEALKTVYATVDDIDLYPGLLMETPSNGAMIGRTGSYIIAEAFKALKYSDRFYYESSNSQTAGLTIEQLNAIRKTTLSQVLCESTDTFKQVNKDIFDLNSSIVDCSELPSLDINPFLSGIPPPPPPPGGSPPRGGGKGGDGRKGGDGGKGGDGDPHRDGGKGGDGDPHRDGGKGGDGDPHRDGGKGGQSPKRRGRK